MSRTIHGKIDWDDGGKPKFGDPPCDTRIECIAEDIVSCIRWTGEHAGQVEVTISAAELEECNDTYYGCIDWGTGKFQIIIPDDCCFCACANSGESICPGTTPTKFIITFTDVLNCNDTPMSDLNGEHCLDIQSNCSYSSMPNPCWNKYITLIGNEYHITYSAGFPLEDERSWVGVWRLLGDGYHYIFYALQLPGLCNYGTFNNFLTYCPHEEPGAYKWEGHSGWANITNPCD